MGRASTFAFNEHIVDLPRVSLIFTVHGAGSSISARYFGFRILSTESPILLSWGISSIIIYFGIISGVVPEMLTLISLTFSSPRLKILNDVNKGSLQ